jgi:hypothetical protein
LLSDISCDGESLTRGIEGCTGRDSNRVGRRLRGKRDLMVNLIVPGDLAADRVDGATKEMEQSPTAEGPDTSLVGRRLE